MPNFRKRPVPFQQGISANIVDTPGPLANWPLGGPKLQISYIPSDKLTPPKRQLKKHDAKHVAIIAANISRFGMITPIVVDANLRIIAGVGRYLAARNLKLAEVPVIKVEHLSEAELRIFAIADNKLAMSDFDIEELRAEFAELSVIDLDLSIELTGFTTVEIDNLVMVTDPPPPKDEPEEVEEGPAVSQLGDLFVLGDHRLLCGDAEQAESYALVMGEERARMAFSDNPYNLKIKGNVSGLGAVKHDDFVMAAGEMSKLRFTSFLTNVFGHCAAFSVDGAIHYQCMDHRHIREMMDAGEAVYSDLKNLIVWDKQAAGMGTFYRNQHELIFVWKVGTAPHLNNFKLGQTGRFRSNVWSYPGVNMKSRTRLQDLALHPTVKNLTMVADAIRDVTQRGDFVLDPFCGSGTTIMAAERTGRRARCIELGPKYVDVAIRRWEKATGRAAVHVETGLTFAELFALRADGGEA